jgi:hypothetical protein
MSTAPAANGLPLAPTHTGKTNISRALERYLRWTGAKTTVSAMAAGDAAGISQPPFLRSGDGD